MDDMKKLAIEGHKTRGNEVIELLEMLGGKNIQRLNGALSKCYYIIDNQSISVCPSIEDDYVVYTLEEFKEKFPYKVGDKVIAYAEGCLACFTLQDIRWNNKLNKIEYRICSSWYDTSLMQPYKEETITIDDFKANTKEIDDKIYTNISQLKVVNDIDMGKNIFGYKPDDIVFVDEINWVKITKIVTRKHTHFSRVMNWHNSFANLNFFLIQTIKKRKKIFFFQNN